MGTEPDEAQSVRIGFMVDQHQVRLHVAITVVLPVAGERMVAVSRFQRAIIGEGDEDRHQITVERWPVAAPGHTFVVAFELAGPLNRPHGDRP